MANLGAGNREAYLPYVSEAASPMERPMLEALVRRAGAQNARVGITGLLLYGAGHFMQLLEGDVLAVERLFDRIAEDPRHQHVRRLAAPDPAAEVRRLALGETPRRVFRDWCVGALELAARRPLDRGRLRSLVERSLPALCAPTTCATRWP